MVSDTALGRTAVNVVLDPVPGVDLDLAVVQVDGEVAGELPLNLPQDLAQLRLQPDDLGRGVELALGRSPFARLFGGSLSLGLAGMPRRDRTRRWEA